MIKKAEQHLEEALKCLKNIPTDKENLVRLIEAKAEIIRAINKLYKVRK